MPEPTAQDYAEFIASLPVSQHRVSEADLSAAVEASGRKVVVLDDDPTGCQTVHDAPIWTVWDAASLMEAMRAPTRLFFVMTNSRSLPEREAAALNHEAASNLAQAARSEGVDFALVSRSDSTLRGHFPAETDALQEELRARLGWRLDGVLIVPFFAEGGRLTAQDVHWVRRGEQLIPAAQTEFARDPAFGYTHSNLREWVAEKTGGRARAEVCSISLEDIRLGGPERVAARLGELHGGQYAIVNAATYQDMDLFVMGLLRAEGAGRRYLYRTGASFVRSRAAVSAKSLLTAADLLPADRGAVRGLVIVGSFVQRSTEQLQQLLQLPEAQAIELGAALVVDAAQREGEIGRVLGAVEEALNAGRLPVVYTTRQLVSADKEASLRIGQQVSAALVEVVRRLRIAPAWLIAKGGITSNDIATKGLGVRRATVAGQIAPGVPVWLLGEGSRFPGMPYVVFPGNVGQPETLAEIARALRRVA
jgi:uncharacterized protein YgbK (DUF1537 family)